METLGVQTLLELDQKISTFVLLIGHLRHLRHLRKAWTILENVEFMKNEHLSTLNIRLYIFKGSDESNLFLIGKYTFANLQLKGKANH